MTTATRDIARFSLSKLQEAVDALLARPSASDDAQAMAEDSLTVWAFARASQALLWRSLDRGVEARSFLARLQEERAFCENLALLFSKVRTYGEALPRTPGLTQALALLAPAEREAAEFLAQADPLIAKLQTPRPVLTPEKLAEIERPGRDRASTRSSLHDALAELGIDPREVGAGPAPH